MRGMRVSVVARLVSHPTIDFGSGRGRAHRSRLGLEHGRTVYHRPRRSVVTSATIAALRAETSRFRFPAVGHATRLPARRPALPFGLPRARRV
jgi:hypothetical protein